MTRLLFELQLALSHPAARARRRMEKIPAGTMLDAIILQLRTLQLARKHNNDDAGTNRDAFPWQLNKNSPIS
ncbi:hypothetical protein [Polaromonas sp.]|uniref:hypothetical protein n=1 Tax=Polaromonas sp. TaxID=1869339 RepID=UPI0024885AC3|nr:hypothetical protein [Polaromonas sp.]MDI1273690.1 hypothetical protein [Polaromonas sp.]